jgi:hypothetical protein
MNRVKCCAPNCKCDARIEVDYLSFLAYFCNVDCQLDFHLDRKTDFGRGGGGHGGGSGGHGGSRSSSSSRSGGGGPSRSSHRAHSRSARSARHRGGRRPGRYTTGRFYHGGPGFWSSGFGFGYGLWWGWRFPWFAAFFPYSVWFPWSAWLPYYYAPEAAVLAYTNQAIPVPNSAYVINPEFSSVPALPTFSEVGIDVTPLRSYDDQRLSQSQQQQASQLEQSINQQLLELRRQNAEFERKGYHVVPDFDREQFSWVKEQQQQQQQEMNARKREHKWRK